jgi:hypothetical protein
MSPLFSPNKTFGDKTSTLMISPKSSVFVSREIAYTFYSIQLIRLLTTSAAKIVALLYHEKFH